MPASQPAPRSATARPVLLSQLVDTPPCDADRVLLGCFGLDRRQVDRCEESIAAARQRFDEAWILSRIVERFAQPADRAVQPDLEIHERLGIPERALKLFSRHHLAGPTRRGVLSGGGAVATGALLAACGTPSGGRGSGG